MVERFLFDRIDAKAARAPVRVELDRTGLDASDEAQTTLTFMHLARARANIALNATVGKCVPVLSGMEHCKEANWSTGKLVTGQNPKLLIRSLADTRWYVDQLADSGQSTSGRLTSLPVHE
jgi:hypothetical protein